MGSFEILKKRLRACHKLYLFMVSGALTGVGRIKHEYNREKKKKIPCHTVALGIDLRRSPLDRVISITCQHVLDCPAAKNNVAMFLSYQIANIPKQSL